VPACLPTSGTLVMHRAAGSGLGTKYHDQHTIRPALRLLRLGRLSYANILDEKQNIIYPVQTFVQVQSLQEVCWTEERRFRTSDSCLVGRHIHQKYTLILNVLQFIVPRHVLILIV
jgi:hypothetical protein